MACCTIAAAGTVERAGLFQAHVPNDRSYRRRKLARASTALLGRGLLALAPAEARGWGGGYGYAPVYGYGYGY